MSIFSWFSGLFSDDSTGLESSADIGHDSISSCIDDSAINPANGLPMVGGKDGVDVEGNSFGTDFSHGSIGSGIDDSFSSGIDDLFSSGIDDSFSSGGGSDNW